MKYQRMIISFAGSKAELHTRLKVLCAQSKKTISGTVVELIEEYLEKNESK